MIRSLCENEFFLIINEICSRIILVLIFKKALLNRIGDSNE